MGQGGNPRWIEVSRMITPELRFKPTSFAFADEVFR